LYTDFFVRYGLLRGACHRTAFCAEGFGLTDDLMMIDALDQHGCPPVTPRQAPADIWHDLTAFDPCAPMAAERLAASRASG
jgi:hypothetical protein